MFSTFRDSFLIGLRQWRIAAIVYFFQLCLALTVGLQVFNVLEASIGNSLEINKLIENYDYTVISDFLKIHGASITPLLGQLRWLVLIYVLFAVFIDAGMLVSASKSKEAKVLDFWQGGANYFLSFLKVALLFLVFTAIWTILIFLPHGIFFQPALEYFPNEKYVIWGTIISFVIYVWGLSYLFLWSVCSRFWNIQNGTSFFTSLKKGWQHFWQHKNRYWGLLCLFFVLQTVLIALYWILSSFLGMTSPFLIVFMALIQQAFSFFRVMIRQMLYVGIGSINNYIK